MVRNRWTVTLVACGLVLTWIGGYVRSSSPSVCMDGVHPSDSYCHGKLVSDAWQVTGLLSLDVGIALVLGSLLLWLVRTRIQRTVPSGPDEPDGSSTS